VSKKSNKSYKKDETNVKLSKVAEKSEEVLPGMCEKLSVCIGRELVSTVNPPDVQEEHDRITGKKVRTRFPPEPNG